MRADGAVRPKQRFDVIERRLLIVEMLCGEDGLCHALNLAIAGRFVKYYIVPTVTPWQSGVAASLGKRTQSRWRVKVYR
jgi:hypothetical protein